MIIKKLLVVFVFCLSFITPVFLVSSVSYSSELNSFLVKFYYICQKHPPRHFVEYYFPPHSQNINSNNYTNYDAWKSYDYFIVQPNGKPVSNGHKLSWIKMNNGYTYYNDGSLSCFSEGNKMYIGNNKGIVSAYVKNNVIYGANNSFIASMHKIGPLTSFYDIQDRWLGLRADLSQENILTYLAFYYNPTNNHAIKIVLRIYGVNSNYILSLYNKNIGFYYVNNTNKLLSPILPLGHKDNYSFYSNNRLLVGTFHPKTGLITDYKNVVIGKITKDGYVYGKTNNLLGIIGKFIYNKEKNNYTAPIYNAKGKYIADIVKYYKKTN